MPSRLVQQALVVILALAAMGSAAAWTDRNPRHDPRNDGGMPASVRRIQRETGGEVLKAQSIQRDGREMYRVKVLTPQGRIRIVEDVVPPDRDQDSSEPPRRNHPE